MIHITMTGILAGKPICTFENPDKTFGDRDRFCHMPYTGVDKFLANPDLCPSCKDEWNGAE